MDEAAEVKVNSLSGLMSAVSQNCAQVSRTDMQRNSLRLAAITNDRMLLSQLYAESGMAQTLVEVPVQDAFRGGLDVSTPEFDDDDIRRLQDYMEEYSVLEHFAQSKIWTRLFGGGGLIVNAGQNPELPFNINKIKQSTPLEFYPVDRWELSSPLGGNPMNQYKPTFRPDAPFMYYDQKIHQSHVLISRGKEAPSLIRAHYMGWGMSEIERMIRSMNLYTKHANVVFELLDESKLDVFGISGMNSALSNPNGTAKIAERIQAAAEMKNYQNALAMDSEDTYTQKQLSFGGLSDILEQIRIGAASDCRFPLTKLFGLTPTGLSTSDDIENYNGMIESEVRSKSRAGLNKLLKICCMKVFGYAPETLAFKFQPLRELTVIDQSTVMTQRMNRILAAFQNGVINERTVATLINQEHIFNSPIPVDEALSLEDVQELRGGKPAPTTPGYGAGTSVVTT